MTRGSKFSMMRQINGRPLRLQSESPKCRKKGSSVVAIMQSQAEWAAAKQRFPILPPRGEEAKSRASIPHGLQNGLATGGMRETLHYLQRRSAAILFLHESRRYVCRFCASHLCQVKKELQYRSQSKRKKQHQKPKATQNQNTQPPKEGSNLLRNSCGHVSRMRRGETGAMNSAKLSVLLVPQQTD